MCYRVKIYYAGVKGPSPCVSQPQDHTLFMTPPPRVGLGKDHSHTKYVCTSYRLYAGDIFRTAHCFLSKTNGLQLIIINSCSLGVEPSSSTSASVRVVCPVLLATLLVRTSPLYPRLPITASCHLRATYLLYERYYHVILMGLL